MHRFHFILIGLDAGSGTRPIRSPFPWIRKGDKRGRGFVLQDDGV
jgi:hypothetical protein